MDRVFRNLNIYRHTI